MRIAAAAATLPWVGAAATNAPQPTANRRHAPKFAVAEQVPEAFVSVPFESQELGGLLAERMRTNVQGRLLPCELRRGLSVERVGWLGRLERR
jgi:hypothetical protein